MLVCVRLICLCCFCRFSIFSALNSNWKQSDLLANRHFSFRKYCICLSAYSMMMVTMMRRRRRLFFVYCIRVVAATIFWVKVITCYRKLHESTDCEAGNEHTNHNQKHLFVSHTASAGCFLREWQTQSKHIYAKMYSAVHHKRPAARNKNKTQSLERTQRALVRSNKHTHTLPSVLRHAQSSYGVCVLVAMFVDANPTQTKHMIFVFFVEFHSNEDSTQSIDFHSFRRCLSRWAIKCIRWHCFRSNWIGQCIIINVFSFLYLDNGWRIEFNGCFQWH